MNLRSWARRFGDRPLARSLAILSLALGIGSATAVWAVFEVVLVRPLPFADPDRLVAIWSTLPGTDAERADVGSAPVNVRGLAESQRVFEGVAAWRTAGFDLIEDGLPERMAGARVEPSLFALLGTEPRAGRWLDDSDLRDPAVAVVSEGLARRRLGGVSVVGRTIRLDGRSHRVVGVAGRGDALPTTADVWVPFELERPDDPLARISDLTVVGRLRAGATLASAARDLDRVASALAGADPTLNRNRGLRLEPLAETFRGDVRAELSALLVAVVLMLLVACVNAANLAMVRARENALAVMVRRALGASPTGVLVRGIVDGLVVAGFALVLGLGFAWLALPRFVALSGIDVPIVASLLDIRVAGFAIAATLITALATGLAPALTSRRVDLAEAFRSCGRCIVGDRRGRQVREWLVVLQVAVGLLLVWGALATTARVGALLSEDPGYVAAGVLTVRVAASPDRHPGLAGRTAFHDALLGAFAGIPGVTAVGGTNVLPVGDPDAYWSFSVEDRPPADPTVPEVARGRLVSPGYFRAMGTPVLTGREFLPADRADGLPVVIVSRRLADRYWPGESPVGRRIKRRTWDSPYPWMTVVGVVGDVRDDGQAEPAAATIYFPLAQTDSRFGDVASFVLRTNDGGVAGEVRRRLAEVDPEAPVIRLATLESLLRESLATERFAGSLLSGFAGIGLVLLIAGVYGLLALVVAERRPEIALRLALGASPARVVRDVVGRGMVLVGAGIGAGIVGALATRPILSRLAHEATIAGLGQVAGLVALVALLAAGIPAIRAARTDPAASLDGR